MPIAKLPLGEFLPDVGEIENPGLSKASGAIFYAGRWHPAPFIMQHGTSSDTDIPLADGRGFHIHSVEDSNINQQSVYIYAASVTDIFRSNAVNSLTLTSATGALAALTSGAPSGLQFVSFGNQILATNYVDHMIYASAPATDFINLALYSPAATPPDNTSVQSYRPKARYITTIKNQILIGHVQFDSTTMPTNSALTASTAYPSLVMWSAIDNPRLWGSPASTQEPEYDGSDYQLLADEFGAITGLVGGDYAYIFKERAIYRMDGPPYTFRPVVTGSGTIYCNSIVKYYDDIYFWGPAGPTVLRSGSSTPETLGIGKVSKTISDASQSDLIEVVDQSRIHERPNISVKRAIDISGFADYKTGLIGWMCSATDTLTSGGELNWRAPGKVIVYSTVDNAFSYFYVGAPAFFPKTQSQYHYTNLFGVAEPDGFFFNDTLFLGIGNESAPATPGDLFVRGFGLDTVVTGVVA
jgi:hypothetical protein